MFFYSAMTIYFPFILIKSNRVWFEKYRLGISFVSSGITKQTIYSVFHNLTGICEWGHLCVILWTNNK